MNTRPAIQEFELSDADFERLRSVVYDLTGIALADSKKELVYSRLARRLRKLKLDSFSAYCSLVESGDPEELQELTNAITTNLTSFFRENYHFEQLASEALPQIRKSRAHSRRIRVWSAGCSTGEESYSAAIVLREELAALTDWDIRLLATDIDSKVLTTAGEGLYPKDRFAGMAPERVTRWFKPLPEKPDHYSVVPELKSSIIFKQLNLLDSWPMKGPFDVIFCRNVVIYFDKATQRKLFARMAELQEPGGWLFVGHSENLFGVTDCYKLVGRTVYRRLE
jgi:chemotaxis protein methyltransferase CheR